MNGFIKNLRRNRELLLMVLPGAIWFLIFSYLPMFGTVIAFKDFRYSRKGFFYSIIHSKWVGLKNFRFLFQTNDAWIITRNTVLYNALFIALGLVISVFFAIILSEISNKVLAKYYQTAMFMPYFLSWVVIAYFAFSFLSVDKGMLNSILVALGFKPVQWYTDTRPWPFILTFMNIWKGTGYGTVVYLAAIVGIDKSYYEAAMLDGATKWQQIKYITLPMLKPLMIMLTVLAIGRIFYADFGLFYQIPKNSGPLFPVTNVIDTFVYRGLTAMGDVGMSAAAGFYQSLVGFILVLTSNFVLNKIDKENALF